MKPTDTQKIPSLSAAKHEKEDAENNIGDHGDDFFDDYDYDIDAAAAADEDNDGERSEISNEQPEESNNFKGPVIISTTTLRPSTPPDDKMTHYNKRRVSKTSSIDGTDVLTKKARTSNDYSSDDYGGRGDGDDHRKLFLLSLLPDVRTMTDTQMRRFRRLVLEAIDVVLDETPNARPGHT